MGIALRRCAAQSSDLSEIPFNPTYELIHRRYDGTIQAEKPIDTHILSGYAYESRI